MFISNLKALVYIIYIMFSLASSIFDTVFLARLTLSISNMREKSSLLNKLLRYFAQIKRQTLILLLSRTHHGKNYDVANKFFSLIYTCSLWGCHTFYLCNWWKNFIYLSSLFVLLNDAWETVLHEINRNKRVENLSPPELNPVEH